MIIKSTKQELRNRGIYKITNLINNKIYIGSTKISFRKRYGTHIYDLNTNTHCNEYLQNSYIKYGSCNFQFEIIEIINDIVTITEREQYWLDFYKCYNKSIGYNILKYADSSYGFKHTEETKTYLSIIKKGRKQHINTYIAIMKANVGAKRTNDTKQKISLAHKGKVVSNETRLKMSIIFKGKPLKNGRKIMKCDLDFNIINLFDNLSECSNDINMSMSNIRSICNGRTIQPKDFILMYETYSLDWKRTNRKMELKWRD